MKKAPEAPRMGRPPLPPEARREHRVDLRVTADEYAALAARAEEEGVSPSSWARAALVRAVRRKKS